MTRQTAAILLVCVALALSRIYMAGQTLESAPAIRFRDVAPEAGLNFSVANSATPEKHYIETMPGGVAAFDYNGDGKTDIFFTNGAAIPSLKKESARYRNRLFRNDGDMKFTDVTDKAGVGGEGYSMGAAAADYDNDGHVDLFVAGVNRNILYRNKGDGTFEDVTVRAGIHSGKWAVAGAWLDYDNDGRLDLFVVNYVQWSFDAERFCGDPARNIRVYCHPRYFGTLTNTLYRNLGDGTFEDVTAKSHIGASAGKGMGVAIADYDLDGWMDVFVTNDSMPNFLFHNRGDGTFEEEALEAGVAMRDDGLEISNMGVDFRDINNDGLPDLCITALAGQTFPFFRNLGKRRFQDFTYASRLARLSLPLSGWGIAIADLNNDGWKDIFAAGAHVNDLIEQFEANQYRLHNAVLTNLGKGTFADGTSGSGFLQSPPRAHRGAAVADFNNDGKLDVVVSALNEPAELWMNTSPGPGNWLTIRLQGTKSNRDGIGARVRVDHQYNHMTTSFGYASSSHTGVHFGLGSRQSADEVEVRWPSGIVQKVKNVKANQVLTIKEQSP